MSKKKPMRFFDGKPYELLGETRSEEEVDALLQKLEEHNQKGKVIKDNKRKLFSVYRLCKEELEQEEE